MTSASSTEAPRRKRKGPGSGKVAPAVVFNGSNIVDQLDDPPPKIGRPSEFSQEMADEICAWLAKGKSLRSFCLQDRTPETRTVMRWLDANPPFQLQYARAKDEGIDRLAELAIDEATSVLQAENVQAARLAFDARRWYASKVAPKRYADKLDLRAEVSGPGGGPLQIEVLLGQAMTQPGFLDRFDDDEIVFITNRIVPKLLAPSPTVIDSVIDVVAETVATVGGSRSAEAAGAFGEEDGGEDASEG